MNYQTWMKRIRLLNAKLAIGEINQEEYERRYDEMLGELKQGAK